MMIRRFTSAPKPASRVAAITCSALAMPSSPTRSPKRMASNRARLEEHLAGQDQVVGRQRVDEVRAGHLDDLGAEAGQQLDRLGEPLLDPGRVALAAAAP